MKKSIKRFLLTLQVLGLSALLASACSSEGTKNNPTPSTSDVTTKDEGSTANGSSSSDNNMHDPTVKHQGMNGETSTGSGGSGTKQVTSVQNSAPKTNSKAATNHSGSTQTHIQKVAGKHQKNKTTITKNQVNQQKSPFQHPSTSKSSTPLVNSNTKPVNMHKPDTHQKGLQAKNLN